MNPQITVQNLSEIKLIGITHIGEFEKIPHAYEQVIKWAFEKELVKSPSIKTLTIYHDNPRITQISKVRWSACLVVDNNRKTEGMIRNLSIQKGKYAVGHFEIEGSLFEKAWETVLNWGKKNGYDFDDRDYFELYYNDFRTHPEYKFILDICIPIK